MFVLNMFFTRLTVFKIEDNERAALFNILYYNTRSIVNLDE